MGTKYLNTIVYITVKNKRGIRYLIIDDGVEDATDFECDELNPV